jgi:hypothetical protein
MASTGFAALLPDDVSTFTDLKVAVIWAKVPMDAWTAVTTALGEPGLSDYGTISTIELADWLEAVKTAAVSPVIRARLNLLVNVIRKQQGQPLEDWRAGAASGTAPPAPASAALMQLLTAAAGGAAGGTSAAGALAPMLAPPILANEESGFLHVKHFFDQGCRLMLRPAPAAKIKEMRNRWLAQNALEPSAGVKLSDSQLSVLHGLSELGHNLLGFDMGVWGPYSSRRERSMMCTAHHLNAFGKWVPHQVPGAECIEDWLEAWAFATSGFVHGAVVERGVADAYRDAFKIMCGNYEKSWWICSSADWEYRHEYVPDELRRQQDFHDQAPTFSPYKPDMPYNSVLLAGVKGPEAVAFWEDRLKERARKWEKDGYAAANPSWVHRQQGLFTPMGGAPPSHGSGGGGGSSHAESPGFSFPPPVPPAGQGKRANKRKNAEMARSISLHGRGTPQQQQQQHQGGNWRAWVDERHPDGRFKRSDGGIDLCYNFGRAENGCSTICSGTPQRAHVCEWCRGGHRSIGCPVYLAQHGSPWVPPAKGKGKGKGKGKMSK